MTEITETVEAEGTEVTIAQWAATLTDEEQEQLAAETAAPSAFRTYARANQPCANG